MILFINLFFVPFIALYMHYKRRNKEPSLNGGLVVKYGVAVAAVFAVTKALLVFFSMFFNFVVTLESISYTVAAVVISLLLPLVYDFLRKIVSVRVSVEENEKK
ncbi:MAG: hypothetical protein IJ072_00040 [Oscillospiraceae bacterium]|nr:hypothetical protein [Oscillospiraceae bacterium]